MDIDQLKTVSADLKKPINVLYNDVVKKTVYDKLVAKLMWLIVVNCFKKAAYNTKTKEIMDKNPNHDKHITTPKFKKPNKKSFNERLKQTKLENKGNIYNFLLKVDFYDIDKWM